MIRNFSSKCAKDVFDGVKSKNARKLPLELHDKAQVLLDQLNAVTRVETLRVPPGNCLEKLSGNLRSFWSLRINIQWRIIFRWENSEAQDVDIVDYHK